MFRDRSSFETRMSFTSLSGMKATQVAVWIDDCVSCEFRELPNSGFTSSWCQLAGFERGTQGGVHVIARVQLGY